MQILLWLVPAVVVTLGAMLVAGWAGRARPEADRSSDAAQERFARAIAKQHPARVTTRARSARDRSTGVAVRARRAPVQASAEPAPAVVEEVGSPRPARLEPHGGRGAVEEPTRTREAGAPGAGAREDRERRSA